MVVLLPPSSRVPGSILSMGFCLCGFNVHGLHVGFLWVLQFPSTLLKACLLDGLAALQ